MAGETDSPTHDADHAQVVVVHPRTGEALTDLKNQPPAKLTSALYEIRLHQDELKQAGKQLEEEIRRRMDIRGRNQWVAGAYAVSLENRNQAQWDADELEAALRELVDAGVLDARELTDVIRHETTVNRTEINRVLGRLADAPKRTLERCRTWKRVGTGRLKLEPAGLATNPPELEEKPF